MKHLHTFSSFLNEAYGTGRERAFDSYEDAKEFLLPFAKTGKIVFKDKGQLKWLYDGNGGKKLGTWNEKAGKLIFDIDFESNESVNEAFKDTREIVGKEMEDIIDALEFLGKSAIGVSALNKACKGKVPFTIFLTDEKGFPKTGGLHMSSIDFIPNASSGMKVEEYIDCINKVLNDHGYDKFEVKILK
jgi:hypothetical protein